MSTLFANRNQICAICYKPNSYVSLALISNCSIRIWMIHPGHISTDFCFFLGYMTTCTLTLDSLINRQISVGKCHIYEYQKELWLLNMANALCVLRSPLWGFLFTWHGNNIVRERIQENQHPRSDVQSNIPLHVIGYTL
jgi:hypothetical protein